MQFENSQTHGRSEKIEKKLALARSADAGNLDSLNVLTAAITASRSGSPTREKTSTVHGTSARIVRSK